MLHVVEKLEEKLKALDGQMADPDTVTDQGKMIELNRERRRLETILETGRRYRQVKLGLQEAEAIIAEDEDEELTTMAREELQRYQAEIETLEQEFRLALLPRDPDDDRPAIVEIRAGTGGDEAGLFVGDIFRMYQRFADNKHWKFEVLGSHPSEVGGFKEIAFSLTGEEAYGLMKFESGVHRVQRVPQTETQGRIHTSAISVAVLPEARDMDIDLKEADLKIDVFRSSGPGGQSVNTTDSAVRIKHLPTGMVVTCQDEKSQLKNKNKAMKVLRARLYDQMMAEQHAQIAAERRSMISTGDRSAKIRTYNFPQSRVTDHRIGLTLYKLDQILQGEMDELIDALRSHDQEARLKLQDEEVEEAS